MFIPAKGFAPDADFSEPGVWTDCDLLIPTLKGFKALPQGVPTGVATAPSTVAAITTITTLGLLNRTIMGTEGSASAATASLYEVGGTAWTARNGASGPYTATGNARWVFSVYSNQIFAAQKGTQLLRSPGDNQDFTVVTGAPQALICVSVLDQIVLFNIDDGGAVYGDDSNRWWCSAAGNPFGGDDSWTANIATQATTGLLTDGDGPIIAGARVGSDLVAFKPRIAYIGKYVGEPQVWAWQRIPGDGLGAWSHYSVVDVEGIGLLFPGRDNFYLFDGSRATPIGTNMVAEFFLGDLDTAFAERMVGLHERRDWRVYWWYPSVGGGLNNGTLDRFVVYNYRSQKWGFGRKSVTFPFEYNTPGITWDDLGSYYTTFDDLPAAPYDNAFLPASARQPAHIGTDGVMYTLTGTGEDSYYTTGYGGNDGAIVALTRIRPRFMVTPTTGEQDHQYVDQLGASPITSVTARNMVDGAFDHVFAARWHRVTHRYTGDVELTGFDIEMQPDSLE